MRFHQQYEASQYQAWKNWYLPYESLKVLIKISFPSPGELRRSIRAGRHHIDGDDISTLVTHRRMERQILLQQRRQHTPPEGTALCPMSPSPFPSSSPSTSSRPLHPSHSAPDGSMPHISRLVSIENVHQLHPIHSAAAATSTSKPTHIHITPPDTTQVQIQSSPRRNGTKTHHVAVSPRMSATTSLLSAQKTSYGTTNGRSPRSSPRHLTIDTSNIHSLSVDSAIPSTSLPHTNGVNDDDDDDEDEDDSEVVGLTVEGKIERIIRAIRKDLIRIDPFFRRIEAELMASLHTLHQQLHHMKSDGLGQDTVRNAFIQLLKKATMAVNFVALNKAAVDRLLYHLEQRSHMSDLSKKYCNLFQESYMGHSTHIEQVLIPGTYKAFADAFEQGDVEAAKVLLLSKMTDSEQNSRDTFLLGLKCGVIFMLMMWILLILTRPLPNAHVSHMMTFGPVYRAIGCMIMIIWMWGCVVAVWERWRISYVFVFQLNPRTRLTEFQLFTEAANLSIVYLVNALLLVSHHERALDNEVSSLVYPLSLFVYVICKCCIPLPVFSHWSSRTYIFQSLGQIVVAPFGRVRFRDCFVADVLTSCVKILVDLEYCICLYATGIWLRDGAQKNECTEISRYVVPFICAFPLFWRFQQCMRRYWDTRMRYPHMWNALKYLLAHSIVIVSTLHPALTDSKAAWKAYRVVWLFCLILSTLYGFWWDVALDWGLFDRQHGMLREQLVFQRRWIYYYAIISNFFLRFLWCVTIIPFSFEKDPTNTTTMYLLSHDYIVLPIMMIGELFRRFQWAIFRVEWEHIANHRSIAIRNFIFIEDDTAQQKTKPQPGYGVMCEVIFMVFLLVVIAIIGIII